MKVILLTEVKNKGGEGDVVDVAPGFANNYLLPQGMAVLATKGNLKQLEQRKHNIAKREEKRIADAEALKSQLEGIKVKVDVQVGEEGQLFGSVTTTMIADAIKAATDLEVDKRRLELGHAIKTAGEHEVVYGIYRDIKVSVTVEDGKITAIDIVEHAETAGISDPAFEKIPAAIIENQSLAVDTISGATNTSKGLLAAVEAACAAANLDVEALKGAAPCIGPETVLVSLMNGLGNEDKLVKAASPIWATKKLSTTLYIACTSMENIAGRDMAIISLKTGAVPILFSCTCSIYSLRSNASQE